MSVLGKLLIISGIFLIVIGVLFYLFGKVGFVGRLPGDIYVEKKNFTFYFPLATCVVFSLFLTLFFWLFSRR